MRKLAILGLVLSLLIGCKSDGDSDGEGSKTEEAAASQPADEGK
jgi:hypothetical protein